MITLTGLTETDYFLPDDSEEAMKVFLGMLHSPGETFIQAYNFSMAAMYDEIKIASKNGVIGHALIDHTQETTPSEHTVLLALVKECTNWTFVVTTAGAGQSPSQIFHWKAMVVKALDGGEDYAWEGSVNMSASGWKQGNSARFFRNNTWSATYISYFKQHQTWALTNCKQYQIQ